MNTGQNVLGGRNKIGAGLVCWENIHDPGSGWGRVEEETLGRRIREQVSWEC